MFRNMFTKGWFSSLRLRLPIIFIAATAIPLIAFSIFSYSQVSSVFVQQKLGDMMNIIDTKYIHVLDFLDKGKIEVDHFSDNRLISSDLAAYYATRNAKSLTEMSAYLNHLFGDEKMTRPEPFNRSVPTRNRYDELMVLDNTGKVVVSTRGASVGRDLSNTDYFTRGRQNVFVKDVYQDYTGKNVLAFVAPIRDENNNFLGVFASKVDAGFLQLIMTGELGNLTGGKLFFAGYSKSVDFYIMNKDGLMISQSRTTTEDTVLKQKGSELPAHLAMAKTNGTRTTNVGVTTGDHEAMELYKNRLGDEVAGASMVVFDIPWTVVIEENTADAFAPINELKRSFIWAVLLITILAGAVGIYVSRRIISPIDAINDVVDKVSVGDLTAKIKTNGNQDEMGNLSHNLNKMVGSLHSITTNVTQATNDIASASSEIFAAASQHNASASEQAASINEASATVDEVRQTAEQTTDRAQSVADLAQKSVNISASGQTALEDTIRGMNRIKEKVETIAENTISLSEHTQQIGDIISTVNDIAEQSNLLALNAAIEAARAGEQGKGFAVVATEVKNLAEQSQAATAQIRSILDDIQKATNDVVIVTEEGTKDVDAGVKLANQAGETIRQLAEAIHESSMAAQQIVASARQQSTGMDQISTAMERLNMNTNQSLANTKQTEGAAQNLSELGVRLKELVATYKVGEGGNSLN